MNLRNVVESKILFILLTYKKELIQTPGSETTFDIIRKHSLNHQNFEDVKHQMVFKSIENQIHSGLADIDFLKIVEYRPKEYKVFEQQANEFLAMVISLTNMSYAPFSDLEKLIYKLKEYNLKNWWLTNGQKILSTNFEVNSIIDFGNEFVENYNAYSNSILAGVNNTYENKDEQTQLMEKFNAHLKGINHDVPIPLKCLEKRYEGGWTGPDLIVIGARPAMGKTSFALGLIIPPSYTHEILFWSLEVNRTQIMNKLASHLTGISFNAIKHGKVNQQQLQLIIKAFEFIKLNVKITIIDVNRIAYLEDFKIEANKLHQKGKVKMIMIDYLQLIKLRNKKQQREQEVAEISRELKLLGNQLNVPVIALAQLKRPQEGNIISKPKLTDLRESGAIEQDADIVSFLHRQAYYQDKSLEIPYEQEFRTEIITAKSRDGSVGSDYCFNDVKNLLLHDVR